MRRRTPYPKYPKPLLSVLILLVACAATYGLGWEMNNADTTIHELVLKIFSLVSLGAVMAIVITSVIRIDERH